MTKRIQRRTGYVSVTLWVLALAACGCQRSAERVAKEHSGPTATGPAGTLRRPAEWLADNIDTPDNPAPPVELITRSRSLMGTVFRVMVAPEGRPVEATQAADAVLDESARIELMMSEWRPGSALSKVSAQAGLEPVEVPVELVEVLRRALAVASASDGAFDPSWAALWDLWRFDRPPRVPSRDEVSARLPLVNYRDVVVDAGRVFLRRRGMLLGLGAIAKGYALDRGAALLRGRGFQNFIIYGGGQVFASGARGQRPWRVGIQDPRNANHWFAILELRDASLSTSGDYEHFFEVDGVRYHHILDLKTGFPARNCRSATILAADGMTADALSTAVFILGPRDGFRLLGQFSGAEGVVVDEQNRVHLSVGLRDKVLVGPPTP